MPLLVGEHPRICSQLFPSMSARSFLDCRLHDHTSIIAYRKGKPSKTQGKNCPGCNASIFRHGFVLLCRAPSCVCFDRCSSIFLGRIVSLYSKLKLHDEQDKSYYLSQHHILKSIEMRKASMIMNITQSMSQPSQTCTQPIGKLTIVSPLTLRRRQPGWRQMSFHCTHKIVSIPRLFNFLVRTHIRIQTYCATSSCKRHTTIIFL